MSNRYSLAPEKRGISFRNRQVIAYRYPKRHSHIFFQANPRLVRTFFRSSAVFARSGHGWGNLFDRLLPHTSLALFRFVGCPLRAHRVGPLELVQSTVYQILSWEPLSRDVAAVNTAGYGRVANAVVRYKRAVKSAFNTTSICSKRFQRLYHGGCLHAQAVLTPRNLNSQPI